MDYGRAEVPEPRFVRVVLEIAVSTACWIEPFRSCRRVTPWHR